MTYNELKVKSNDIRKQIVKKKKELKSIKSESENLQKEKLDKNKNFQMSLRNSQAAAHESYIKNASLEKQKELEGLKAKKAQLIAQKDDKLSQLSEDNVDKMYTSENEMQKEVKAVLNVLDDKIKNAISPRFQEELCNQLATQKIPLENLDLEELITYFNKQSEYVSSVKAKDSKLLKYMSEQFLKENPIQKFTGGQEGKQEKIGNIVLGCIAMGIIVLAAMYIFPVCVLILAVYSGYLLCKNYKIYSALIAQKVVQDNVIEIDKALREKALQKLSEKRDDVNSQYEKLINNCDQSISKCNNEISRITLDADKSFTFDDTALREQQDNLLRAQDQKETTLAMQERTLTKEIDDLLSELQKVENNLKEVAGDIQLQYLNFNKVGEDCIFNPKFIIDFEQNKPVYFEHPQSSCLFIYDSAEDVKDFIRLICTQLRIRLNPFNFKISLIDQRFLGAEYRLMEPKNVDSSVAKTIFEIAGDKESTAELFKELSEDIKKRIVNIKASYPDIKHYNEDMIKIGSLTETYNFLFYLNPDIATVISNDYLPFLTTGGILGIFTHLFIEKSEFYEMAKNAEKLLDSIGATYIIENGQVCSRARTYIKEFYIKSSGNENP